ncbi:MAG: hypothetical protein PWP31_1799 [Clostridia bacterium]|nr:hypothetical protein [Clostridia bacterium]
MNLFIKPGGGVPEFHSTSIISGYVITRGKTVREAKDSAFRLCREIESNLLRNLSWAIEILYVKLEIYIYLG